MWLAKHRKGGVTMTHLRSKLNPFFSEDDAGKVKLCEQRQGTLNEQLSYWKGQKRSIEEPAPVDSPRKPNDHFEQSLIKHTAYHNATIELAKYKRVGKPSKSKEHAEIKTYFNSTANKIAYASLLYLNYFDKKLLKKTIVSSILAITAKAASDMVNECISRGYVLKVNTREHEASPYFIEAYLSYINEEVHRLLPKARLMISFMDAIKATQEANK
tara:strand:- start:59 stop:703 length:645 start_codon:yes stop_codon:yes gene_type:complete